MDKQTTREEIIYLARKNPEIALERSNALLAEFPEEVWTWALRSHVYETRGDFENSMADIDQAINIRFDEPGSHCDKARLLMQASEFENAINSFSNAIEIGKKLEFYYYDSICIFLRAFCYCKIQDFARAEADLQMVDDDMQTWIDRLRSKTELVEACHNKRLD
jgi:tetratricopeptide (TPR) repeat protein